MAIFLPYLWSQICSDSKSSHAILLGLLLGGCAPQRDCSAEIWHLGPASEVSIVGDIEGQLEEIEPDAWFTTLDLPAGDYAYQIEVDGVSQPDPFAHLLRSDAGAERSLLRVQDCSVPMISVENAAASAGGGLVVEARFLRSKARLSQVTATFLDGTPLAVETGPGGAFDAQATGLAPGKHTVLLEAEDRRGTTASVRVPLWVEEEPFSWEGAILYQVMIDRFANDDGQLADPGDPGARFGGDLPGLLRVLESGWFDELGVGALWLSPVYDNPEGRWDGVDGHSYEGYHGYWPVSTDKIEPALGTDADLEALVAEAHSRGIRVVLDVVPNHVHQDHPYRTEGREGWFHENPDCVCGDYTCPWDEWIATCWFTDYLPDLALENPEVVSTVVSDTVAWGTRFDLDGFRVDAVPMMGRPAIRELTYGVRKDLGEDFYLLGETFTGEGGYDDIGTNLGPFGLDGQFEFPILWALRELIAGESADAENLDLVIDESEARWAGSGSVMAPFIGNHDTDRFLSVAAGDDTSQPWDAPPPQPTDELPYRKLLMAQATALSLPGAPVIYYGDELGLAGGKDPDSRRAMQLDDLSERQSWTLDRIRRIGLTRACSPSLKTGSRRTLLADGPLFAMVREGGSAVVLVLNASDQAAEIPLPYVGVDRWFDAIEAEPIAGHDISMEPWSARLLIDENSPCSGSAL